jgi:asparagine synthase (glutamine-hydrolysing)
MCGIGGFFTHHSRLRELRHMSDRFAHRGPDDEGVVELADARGEKTGCFAHRRLAIIDLSPAGHQPMQTRDGRFTLTYNGEIYNHEELREDLAKRGATFRGRSDSEVVLLGWAAYGPAFLPQLRGMFAFALWDRDEGRGWLVRDSFGIKPLYVTESRGEIGFASELRALLASGCVPRRLSPDGVAAYLSRGSVTEPLTIVDGIRMVLAGTAVPIHPSEGGFRLGVPVRYGGEAYGAPGTPLDKNPARAARSVRAALRDSVASHLVSDVPVGCFLSGGIDSSIVVALAAELGYPATTFTVTSGEQGFNEAAPAAAVANRFGTDHHEIPITRTDLLDALPAAFAAMDQPSLDGLNTFVVSRAVSDRGIKVALSGLGGDEFFAGYPSFRRAQGIAPLWRLPKGGRWVASRVAASWQTTRGAKAALLLGEETPALAAYRASRALFGAARIGRMVGRTFDDFDIAPPSNLPLLQQVSWLEATGYMRNTLLRDSDVFSMSHGLELRVPFVDLRVAAAAAAVDDSLKLARGRAKPLLVSATEDLLPRDVWDRPKQGFTLPFAVFMRDALASAVEAGFSDERLANVGLDAGEARRVWAGFRAGRVAWSRPWALYTLVRWAEENDVALDDSVVAPARVPAVA